MERNGIKVPPYVRPADCECVKCSACEARSASFDMEAFTARLDALNSESFQRAREFLRTFQGGVS